MAKKSDTKIETSNEVIIAVASVLLGIVSIILFASFFEKGGQIGNLMFSGLIKTIGILAYATPFVFIYSAYLVWHKLIPQIKISKAFSGLLITLSLLGITGTVAPKMAGLLGILVLAIGLKYLGLIPTIITLLALLYIGLVIVFERKNVLNLNKPEMSNLEGKLTDKFNLKKLFDFKNIFAFTTNKNNTKENEIDEEEIEDDVESPSIREEILFQNMETNNDNDEEEEDEVLYDEEDEESEDLPDEDEEDDDTSVAVKPNPIRLDSNFTMPPIDLLDIDSGKSNGGDTKTKAKVIQNTMAEFGVPVEISGVTIGPTVTQFKIKTPQGFKVKNIMNYHDNLQMNLAVDSIHIEAPIPGQPFVGIDVPNKDKQRLGLGTMINTDDFRKGHNLTMAIGKDIVGIPVFGDLESMPHLLIAGATKSGKSVTIQNIIMSLLYKNSPDELKLLIIDPKKIEFTVYKNLPHLYTPVITDAVNAIKCLNWAIAEMERRYDYFAENHEGIQNLSDYNSKIYKPALEKAKKRKSIPEDMPERLPYVVLIFDEFNDFMLKYGKEITNAITSISQKGRAAGIHIILATQRPDVKVINGTIKANIPARIALRTSSRIDSQTIIDQSGAEDLLGNGDMLFLNPGKKIKRVQAPLVTSEEVKAVVKFIKEAYYDYENDKIDLSKTSANADGQSGASSNGDSESTGDDEFEELYVRVREYIVSSQRPSATNIQSKFGLGYAKANRLMMLLEERGVVSPAEGNKRKVLITMDDIQNEDTDSE